MAGPCKLRVDLDKDSHGQGALPQLHAMNSELATVFQIVFLRYRVLTPHPGENNDNITIPTSPDPRYGMDGQAIEPAVQYVQKIKQRCDPDTYRQFLDILSRYHHTPDTIDEVCFYPFHASMYLTGFDLQEQVSKQIAILFKDAPDLRADFRVFIPDHRSQHLMDGPGHTSERHRRKLDAVANSFTHSSLPQKRKRKAAEKEREREKEAAKSAPPAKVCEWYPLTHYSYLVTPYRNRNIPPLRTSHLCHTILNMLQAPPPLVELPIILCRGNLLLTMKLISLIE